MIASELLKDGLIMKEEGKIIAERPYVALKEGHHSSSAPSPKAKKNLFWYISLLFLMVCVLVWGWSELMNPEKFPVRSVQIKGNYTHVNHELLRSTVLPIVQKGFFGLELSTLEDRVSQIPWVYKVTAERVWPDTLKINLIEQQPVAQFSETVLVNAQGDLFTSDKGTIPPNLPVFNGAVGQQKNMLQMYEAILPLLKPYNLQLSSLTLDPRQAWQLELNNGPTVLVGRVEPLQRLQRFFAIFSQAIEPKLAMIRTVDLRYANGMAVRYKENENGETTWQRNQLET